MESTRQCMTPRLRMRAKYYQLYKKRIKEIQIETNPIKGLASPVPRTSVFNLIGCY